MTDPVVWSKELHVAPDTTSPAQARRYVEKFLDQQDLGYLADDVRLVVSELVTNAAVHARTRIRVQIEEMAFCVKLTVYDQSADLPVSSLAARVCADDESGRGLWIVDACSADWGVDLTDGGEKCTWALFAVQPKSSWAN